MRWKQSSIALFLSLIQPGLGQLYNRQVRKAFLFLLVLPALIALTSLLGLAHTFRGFLLFGAASLVFQICVSVEAAVVGFRRDTVSSVRRVSRLAVAGFLVLMATNVAFIVSNFYTVRVLGLGGYVMPSDSMAPTLRVGDRFAVDMRAYVRSTPKRGDIIVFLAPGLRDVIYAKRVVAIAGDTIEGTRHGIAVNGKLLAETSVSNTVDTFKDARNFGPWTVPAGTIFVLNDNFQDSYDSRYFGSVPLKSVRGKLLFIYWSRDHVRIGEALP